MKRRRSIFFFRSSTFRRGKACLVKPLLVMAFFLSSLVITGLTFYRHAGDVTRVVANVVMKDAGCEQIVAEALPGSITRSGTDSGWDLLQGLMLTITSMNTDNPAAILGNELNLIAEQEVMGPLYNSALIVEEEGGEEDFYLPGQDTDLDEWIASPKTEFPPVQLNGEPMVLIYNTHNAETYKPTDGVSKTEGKNGGVAAVSQTMTKVLESRYSIKTVYSEVIHDYPDWTKSYINSMKTVQQLLKKHPDIQVVLDIHRDAGLNSRTDTLVKINGKECAKVMIVIGSEHPNWKSNLAYAEKIEAKAQEMYPGLIKSIRVLKDRRYNQHLHPRALLLEFGSDLNKREDALNSAEFMADVIAAVMKGQ